MAVELLTESPPSLNTSPRISFSSDLSNPQTQNTHQTTTDFSFHSQPNTDFHFSFLPTAAINYHPSPADELFTGGLIRSTLKPIEAENPETDQPIKPTVESIWGIKRSSSLHCEESTHKKGSSFWLLPLLARSNSTGSKQTQKQKQIRNSPSSNSSFSMYNFSQKPPLKKNYYGNGAGIVNPVLNVPSPLYLSKGSFGFGSLFRSNNGKERKNKK